MQIGLLDSSELAGSFQALSGVEFDELDATGQAHAAGSMALFSRVEPSHKTALVELLKSQVRPSYFGSDLGCQHEFQDEF